MTKPTHLTGSLLCGYALGIAAPATIPGLFLGALLCDVDTPHSALGHAFFWQSGENHRGFFHSIFFLGLFILGGCKWQWMGAVAIGVASHILLDTLNTKPIQLFFPLKIRLRCPWSKFKTGSMAETLILVWMLFALFTVFVGPMELIQTLLGSAAFLIGKLMPLIQAIGSIFEKVMGPILSTMTTIV